MSFIREDTRREVLSLAGVETNWYVAPGGGLDRIVYVRGDRCCTLALLPHSADLWAYHDNAGSVLVGMPKAAALRRARRYLKDATGWRQAEL